MSIKIAAGIIGLLVVGAGAYYVSTNRSAPAPGQENTNATARNESLRQLVDAGVSVQCSFSSVTEAAQSSGTAFIANGMVRIDSQSQTSSGMIEAHTVLKDNMSYLWSPQYGQGFKATIDTEVSENSRLPDYDEEAEYECRPWTPDLSKFELPTDIEFAEVPTAGAAGASAEINTEASVQGNAAQCAACEQLTGPLRNACLSSLQCAE